MELHAETEGNGEEAFREVDASDVRGAAPRLTSLPTAGDSQSWKSAEAIAAGPGVALPSGLERVSRPLFEHQKRALRQLDQWWAQGDRPASVLCLPTGGGKTRTAVAFVLRNLSPDCRVLWLAHRVELVTQAIATFVESSQEAVRRFTVGRFDAEAKVKTPSDVVVGSIPTLAAQRRGRRASLEALMKVQGQFALVVVDECHHATARTWNELIQGFRQNGSRLLGLSATPTRSNERERPRLWKLFDHVAYEEPLLELIRHRVLSTPRPVAISTTQSFQASDKERKDFQTFKDLPASLVKRIAGDHARNERIVSAVVANRPAWGQTLVFAGSVDQAHQLSKLLRRENVPTAALDGSTSAEERRRAVQAFKDRQLEVMVNVSLFTEGTDLPGVETVIIARPTRSRILFQQMVGRGMRGPRVGGSDYCNIIMFHDEVEGLLEEALASTFTSEREALSALDVNDIEPKQTPAEPRPITEEPNLHDVHELLQYLDDASRLEGEALEGAALDGWWEARSPIEIAYLPVFRGHSDTVGEWISTVTKGDVVSAGETLRELVPVTVLEAFQYAAERPDSTVKYVSLNADSAPSLAALASRLRAADEDTPVPEWWRAACLGAPTGARVLEDEEGKLVFASEAVSDLLEDWRGLKRRIERGASLSDVAANFYDESYAAHGLSLRDFRRLVRATLTSEGEPQVAEPTRPDEESVFQALRVVAREEQKRVLDTALELGLAANYTSAEDLAESLLERHATRHVAASEDLARAPRFLERVKSETERTRVLSAVGAVLQQGGIMNDEAFATALEIGAYRVPGYVAKLAESLNVDGYRVITFDRQAREVRVDRAKLFQLFEAS